MVDSSANLTMKKLFALAGLALLAAAAFGPGNASAQEPAIDRALAKQYFAEAKSVSDKDNGALWGIPLCGPLLFVDPDTRDAVANQADLAGKLKPANGVFAGTAPPTLGVANTAVTWAGVQWTMVMWPPPQYKSPRMRLMLHECFHRVQEKIGLPPADSMNGHLDSLDGRIWLQMEWRALEHAFWQRGEERRRDIADALYFRNFRRSLFPGAAARETTLEMHEGMAEYTGVKLSTSSPEEFAVVAASSLRSAPTRTPSYARSFAYTSGPAYGGLLDAGNPQWRKGLTPATNLGDLLARAYAIDSPALSKTEALRRAERYDGAEVVAIETRHEEKHQAQVAAARKLFVDGPILSLRVGKEFNFAYDPNEVLSLDDNLTLYRGDVQVSDEWGIMHAPGGVLFLRKNGLIVSVQVPAPADAAKSPLAGKGWTLELKSGWKLIPGERAGDFAPKEQGEP
jgi:hypothetical protein